MFEESISWKWENTIDLNTNDRLQITDKIHLTQNKRSKSLKKAF